MEKIKSIREFINRAKELDEKLIRIQPYILSDKNFPCLRMEGRNIFYEMAINKKFRNVEDLEEFTVKLGFKIGKELSDQGFYTLISDLKYLNKRVENIKEDDIKYLFETFCLSLDF